MKDGIPSSSRIKASAAPAQTQRAGGTWSAALAESPRLVHQRQALASTQDGCESRLSPIQAVNHLAANQVGILQRYVKARATVRVVTHNGPHKKPTVESSSADGESKTSPNRTESVSDVESALNTNADQHEKAATAKGPGKVPTKKVAKVAAWGVGNCAEPHAVALAMGTLGENQYVQKIHVDPAINSESGDVEPRCANCSQWTEQHNTKDSLFPRT